MIIITMIIIILIIIILIIIEIFSESASDFSHELGLRIRTATLEPRETSFLFQHLSIAIQRFNAVCFANIFVFN